MKIFAVGQENAEITVYGLSVVSDVDIPFEKPDETLGDKINLMPKDESTIIWEDEDTVVDYTEDGLTIQAGPNGAEVIYFLDPICYNIKNKPYLNFSLENEGGWDMFLCGYGKETMVIAGMSQFGPDGYYEVPEGELEEDTYCAQGIYSEEAVHLASAFEQWDAVYDDGTVVMTLVYLRVAPGGTLKLTDLYAAAETANTNPTDTDPTESAALRSPLIRQKRAAPPQRKPTPPQGETTEMTVACVLLAVVSAGAVILTRKKATH